MFVPKKTLFILHHFQAFCIFHAESTLVDVAQMLHNHDTCDFTAIKNIVQVVHFCLNCSPIFLCKLSIIQFPEFVFSYQLLSTILLLSFHSFHFPFYFPFFHFPFLIFCSLNNTCCFTETQNIITIDNDILFLPLSLVCQGFLYF